MIKNSCLIKKNKELFNYRSNNKNIILVEYNNFHGSHLCQALLANFFKKKNSSKIIAYFNYSLIVSPLKINFLQKTTYINRCYIWINNLTCHSKLFFKIVLTKSNIYTCIYCDINFIIIFNNWI